MRLRGVLRRLSTRCGRLLRRRARATPPRTIEQMAADVRRLGPRLASLPHGTSYCKVEAVRHAYDRALGECATALEVTHLLGVLPPGQERDRERRRVEVALHVRGLVMHDLA